MSCVSIQGNGTREKDARRHYLKQLPFLLIMLKNILNASPHGRRFARHVASRTTVGKVMVLHGLGRSAHLGADGELVRSADGVIRCGRHSKESGGESECRGAGEQRAA